MRGRILWIMILTTAALVACTRKTSSGLYIEPGKAEPPSQAAR